MVEITFLMESVRPEGLVSPPESDSPLADGFLLVTAGGFLLSGSSSPLLTSEVNSTAKSSKGNWGTGDCLVSNRRSRVFPASG